MESSLAEYKQIRDGKQAFEGQITGVGSVSLFSTGWIEPSIQYEQPEIILEISSQVGDFQLEVPVRQITSSPFFDYIITEFDSPEKIKMSDFLGKKIHIDFGDEMHFATAGLSTVEYGSQKLPVRQGGDSYNMSSDTMDSRMTRTNSRSRANRILRNTLKRGIAGNAGWMKVTLRTKESDDEVVFVPGNTDVNSQWSFDKSVHGMDKAVEFAESVGIKDILEDVESEVWIKPVWDIHYSNRPDSLETLSDDQYWMISSQPREPKQSKSILEKIKSWLEPSDSVSVSVGKSTPRKANSVEKTGAENWCITRSSASKEKEVC